jgi:hypothetical protein
MTSWIHTISGAKAEDVKEDGLRLKTSDPE